MTTASLTVTSGTIYDTPTLDGLVTLVNAELAPLLSHLIKGFTFNAADEARQNEQLRVSVTYEDGATAITNPYKIAVFGGRTLDEVGDAVDAFFAANTGYFFAPLATQVFANTARRSDIVFMLVFYNENAAEGAANYAGSGGGGGSGSVTSVGLSAPSEFAVSGSPVTTDGTLGFSWVSQAANLVFAGPTSGAAATPSFRALVAADIPNLNASKITSGTLAAARGGTGVDGSAAGNGTLLIGNGTGFTLASLTGGAGITITPGAGSITISSTATGTVTSVALAAPTEFTVSGSPVTTSGTLTLAWATEAANLVLAGPTTGAAAAPTFRSLVTDDIPNLSAAKITSGTLATARGGTGVDGSAAGNGTLLIGNSTGYTLANLTAGTGISITNGSGTISIASTATGTIGGSIAATQVAYGSGANTIAGNAAFTFDDTNILLDIRDGSTPTSLTNVKLQVSDNVNNFAQINFENTSSGAAASGDIVVTSDTGTDTINFVDMGINSSGWATGTWTINGANGAYLYSGSTSLAVGTAAAGQNLILFTGGTLAANARETITDTTFVIAPGAATSGAGVGWTYTGPANTGLTASTEVNDWNVNLARTVQWATGAIATQRAIRIQAPTYAFVGASTITEAATFAIAGAPTAGANATITTSYALWVQSGRTQLAGQTFVDGAQVSGSVAQFTVAPSAIATSGTPQLMTVTGVNNTGMTAGTEVNDVNINLSHTVQWATGAIATQRAFVIRAPTYAFVGASTITTASTLSVTGAPTAGTNATITNGYAINVEAGGYGGPSGTAALPTYTVGATRNLGMYSTGANAIGFSTSGTLRLTIDTTAYTATLPWRGQNGSAAAPSLSFSNSTGLGLFRNGANDMGVAANGVLIANFQTTSTQASGNFNLAPATVSSGSACAFRVAAAADTGQTASTAAASVIFDLSATRQFATGAIAQQNAFLINAPTYSAVGASTITTAAVLYISNNVIAGTNVSITNTWALFTAGNIRCNGNLNVTGALANSTSCALTLAPNAMTSGSVPALLLMTAPAHTGLTASTEVIDADFNLARTVQISTGALTTQRAFLVRAPTYGFVGASTITTAATVAITGAPAAGTNATITNAYALWVQAGNSLFAGGIFSNSASAGIGYSTGAGGTVTQTTSLSTGVTLNKICGQITTVNGTINTGTIATFTVTNSTIAAGDNVVVTLVSGNNSILAGVSSIGSGNFNIILTNNSGSNITATFAINFAIIKAVTA